MRIHFHSFPLHAGHMCGVTAEITSLEFAVVMAVTMVQYRDGIGSDYFVRLVAKQCIGVGSWISMFSCPADAYAQYSVCNIIRMRRP